MNDKESSKPYEYTGMNRMINFIRQKQIDVPVGEIEPMNDTPTLLNQLGEVSQSLPHIEQQFRRLQDKRKR